MTTPPKPKAPKKLKAGKRSTALSEPIESAEDLDRRLTAQAFRRAHAWAIDSTAPYGAKLDVA